MASTSPRGLFLCALAFLASGLIAAAVGAAVGWSSWQALSSAERVEGTVVELLRIEAPMEVGPDRLRAAEPTYTPVVEYQVAGQTYRIRGVSASTHPT
jgi:hypothetical protein